MERIENIALNSAKVKFISCKEQFNQQYAYFVIDHEKTKEEFKKVIEQYPDLKMPFFVSDDSGDYILKVKTRFIPGFDGLMLKNQYKANISLNGYSMDGMKGMYAKMEKIGPTIYNKINTPQKVINICDFTN